MWDFMKRKPAPPRPVSLCEEELDKWRCYVLSELETVRLRILEELSVSDPDSLAKLHEIITQYEEVEKGVAASLDLMRAEIKAMQDAQKIPAKGYRLEAHFSPSTGNLEFRLKEV